MNMIIKYNFFLPLCILSALIVLNYGCVNNNKSSDIIKEAVQEANIKPTMPLDSGVFECSDKDFGDIIELTGESRPVSEIFNISETQIIANDSLFIMKNYSNENMLSVFSLPEFKLTASLLPRGRGPMEFSSPYIINTTDKDKLCYVYDSRLDELFILNKDFSVVKYPVILKKEKDFSQKQFSEITDSVIFYVENTKNGKAIFRLDVNKDSTNVQEYYNLSFSKGHKSWAAYIGDFGVNIEKNRMVYAYKYFKRVLFMDIKTGTVRILDFKQKEVDKKDNIGTLGPDNVTHYWGMSTNKNYVYLLYSGRTPIVVTGENRKGNGYIFVEQFDWNGNFVRKFKLDHWGYFGVDENNGNIYQVSSALEQPILSYKLPQL